MNVWRERERDRRKQGGKEDERRRGSATSRCRKKWWMEVVESGVKEGEKVGIDLKWREGEVGAGGWRLVREANFDILFPS